MFESKTFCACSSFPVVVSYAFKFFNPNRKTKYSLVAVKKGDILINIDSGAPNKVVKEWLELNREKLGITYIKPENTYNQSRLDFYYETKDCKAFIEVKGVTLEQDGKCYFPDAPTERGVKHIKELKGEDGK